jgi:hypothetical protein
MKKLLFGLLSLTLLATACKKDKDAPAITKDNITGTYKVMSIKAWVNGASVPDAEADQRQDCEKDDLIKLNADNSYAYQDAGTICDPAGDVAGTWALNESSKVITTDDGEISGTITSFDGTNMDVTVEGSEGGISYKIVTTFKKQ